MSEILFTDEQRKEIDRLVEQKLKSSELSSSQKWGVGVVVSAILVGAIAIFGAAGYFLIHNITATEVARVGPEQAAANLIRNPDFVREVQEGIGFVAKGSVVAFDQKECPKNGWERYAGANGRFIIGAGGDANLDNIEYLDVQNGEHYHELSFPPAVQVQTVPGGSPSSVGVAVHGNTTVKGTVAYPPFIALTYCRKT